MAACGRIGFDASHTDALALDTTSDAAPLISCPIGSTAADPIVVAGRAVSVGPLGGVNDEPNVLVTITTVDRTTTLGTDTSDATGGYSIACATNGTPFTFTLSLAKSGYLTSVFTSDQPMDVNVDMGASFMGTATGTASLYNAAGANARNPSRGTIFVIVEDCAGNRISGATIAVSPAPERVSYSNSLGTPNDTATSTATTGYAWALNVPAGPVTLTAAKSGLMFHPQTVNVLAGDNFMGAWMRPITP